jgi:hypothetical protein
VRDDPCPLLGIALAPRDIETFDGLHGELCAGDPGNQLTALGLVGARQRQQGAKRGARRNAPAPNLLLHQLGKGLGQAQPPRHPRKAATEALGQRSERKPGLLLDLL